MPFSYKIAFIFILPNNLIHKFLYRLFIAENNQYIVLQ